MKSYRQVLIQAAILRTGPLGVRKVGGLAVGRLRARVAGRWSLVLAMAVAAGGCAAVPQFATLDGKLMAGGVAGVMLVDTLQTVTIARSPECFSEGNQVAAAVLGGDHPSVGAVVGVNAALMYGHTQLAAWMDRKGDKMRAVDLTIGWKEDMKRKSQWRFFRRTYQALLLIGHGTAVKTNHDKGLRLATNERC